jgi:hypothetical protein
MPNFETKILNIKPGVKKSEVKKPSFEKPIIKKEEPKKLEELGDWSPDTESLKLIKPKDKEPESIKYKEKLVNDIAKVLSENEFLVDSRFANFKVKLNGTGIELSGSKDLKDLLHPKEASESNLIAGKREAIKKEISDFLSESRKEVDKEIKAINRNIWGLLFMSGRRQGLVEVKSMLDDYEKSIDNKSMFRSNWRKYFNGSESSKYEEKLDEEEKKKWGNVLDALGSSRAHKMRDFENALDNINSNSLNEKNDSRLSFSNAAHDFNLFLNPSDPLYNKEILFKDLSASLIDRLNTLKS